MRIVILSDSHGKHNQVKIPKCDILIHCGDFSPQGYHNSVRNFLNWINKQSAKYKIYIAGNHDLSYDREPKFKDEMIEKFEELIYLENSSVTIEGFKIYGSPNQPEFRNWAFNYKRDSKFAYDLWNKIPSDTDILITHGAPHGILDKSKNHCPPYPQITGCKALLNRIKNLDSLILNCYGHIHEGYGCNYNSLFPTVCINASVCNLAYQPINPPIVIDLDIVNRNISFV